MTYVEQNLISGEQVLYKTGLHWIVLFWPVFFAVFFGLPGLPILIGSIGETTGRGGQMAIASISFLAVAAAPVLLGYFTRKTREMAVTKKRIVIRTGLLSRRTFELLLSKVESIGVEEGLLGESLALVVALFAELGAHRNQSELFLTLLSSEGKFNSTLSSVN